MATGDKLVKLDDLKLVYDKLHVPSVQLQITTGQWSGNGPYTYSANVTNIDANTSVEMEMDETINYLTADLKVTTGSGSITLSTASKPSNTVNVTLFFPGVQSEVNVQVLADVYSKSQTDTLLAAKVSTSNIVNNLTSTNTDKPLSANMGKALNDNIKTWTTSSATSSIGTASYSVNEATKICIVGYAAGANGTGNGTITLPTTIKSKFYTYSPLRGGGYLSAAENSNIITIADAIAWGVGQLVIPFN